MFNQPLSQIIFSCCLFYHYDSLPWSRKGAVRSKRNAGTFTLTHQIRTYPIITNYLTQDSRIWPKTIKFVVWSPPAALPALCTKTRVVLQSFSDDQSHLSMKSYHFRINKTICDERCLLLKELENPKSHSAIYFQQVYSIIGFLFSFFVLASPTTAIVCVYII